MFISNLHRFIYIYIYIAMGWSWFTRKVTGTGKTEATKLAKRKAEQEATNLARGKAARTAEKKLLSKKNLQKKPRR
jgi:hypothetical protein